MNLYAKVGLLPLLTLLGGQRLVLTGLEGDRSFDPRRVQELLDEGEHLLRLSRPWAAPYRHPHRECLEALQ